jgi:hypothetical protein
LQATLSLFLTLHINRCAPADVFLISHPIDTFLHFAMTAIPTPYRILNKGI